MLDYTILYRRQLDLSQLAEASEQWGLFISAFNASERVQLIYDAVRARQKHWLIHPEYRFGPADFPEGACIAPESLNEAEFWFEYQNSARPDFSAGTVCIDLTGFMRPHLMFLTRLLFDAGVDRFL